jgi:hypothetical protein
LKSSLGRKATRGFGAVFLRNGGDMNTKVTRMDKWIESRTTRLMKTGNIVLVDQIMREMSGYFSLDLSPIQRDRLRSRISRIRDRVKKRLYRHKKLLPILEKEWMVDQRLIERWVSAGWVSLQYPKKLRVLTEMFRERDYVRMINPEEIPLESEITIWGSEQV